MLTTLFAQRAWWGQVVGVLRKYLGDALRRHLAPLCVTDGTRLRTMASGVFGLGVRHDDALVVSKHDAVGRHGENIVGTDWDLATAVRRVDDELRHGEAARVTAQELHDLDTLVNRGTEVTDTAGQIALINIVGSDTDSHEFLNEFFHDIGTIVNPLEENGLVANRDPCVGQHCDSLGRFGRHLAGVVELRVEPQRMVLAQHGAEFGRDTLRKNHGGTRADAYHLDVLNLADLTDDILEELVVDEQRVTTGQEDVPNLLVLTNVADCRVDLAPGASCVSHACKASARAVTAIHATLVRNEKEHAIGISMRQAVDRRIDLLIEGIVQIAWHRLQFQCRGNALFEDGIIRIVLVDECSIVRCDSHAEPGECADNTSFLLVGEMDDLSLISYTHLTLPTIYSV